jgi:S-DNA-T family DNA segregation ATPase FtsK/SpoIIIE
MPRRKHYKKHKFKLKLKKDTVYSIFAFGLILGGLLLLLSFTKSGESFTVINDLLNKYFGLFSFLFPVAIILLGFLFLRLKMFISRPNVAVGFLLFFISVVGLFKGGSFGSYIYQFLADILNGLGANLVYIAGILIGLFVFFDTSADELLSIFGTVKDFIRKLVPSKFVGFFKNKKSSDFNNKQMTIRGMEKDGQNNFSGKDIKIINPAPTRKEPLIADKLVMNTVGGGGIWEYPPLSLLSDASNQKADRGDIKKIANKIEETLQSFGIRAKVVEVNLGPAVTQYAWNYPLEQKWQKLPLYQTIWPWQPKRRPDKSGLKRRFPAGILSE